MKRQTQDSLCVSLQIINFMRCCTCKKTVCLRGRPYGLKLSLISCGHTQCENCSRFTPVCNICKTDQTEDDKSHKTLSINAYLMGHSLLAGKAYPTENLISYKVTKKPNIKSIERKINFSESSSYSCFECIKKIATKGCQQCKANFCDTCWTKIHSVGKILQNHISTQAFEHSRDHNMLCQYHEMQDLEFYCKICREYICSLCIVLNHQGIGHRVITLEEKQNGFSEEFGEIVDEVEKNLKKLVETYEEVEEMTTALASDSSFVETQKQVVNKFGHLHGLLQLIEESIIYKLGKIQQDKLDALHDVQYCLEDEIRLCERAIEEYGSWKKSSGMKKEAKSLEIAELLLKARSQPSVLVLERTDENEKILVSFTDSIIHNLMNYCTLNVPINQTYRLTSMFSEENSVHFPILDATRPKNQESEARVENITNSEYFASVIDNMHNKEKNDDSRTTRNPPFANSKITNFNVREGCQYQVIISHVKNAEEFYVRLTSMKAKLTEIEYRAHFFAIKNTCAPTVVQKDNFYLIFCITAKKWYRGKVVEEPLEDSDENGTNFVTVYYLDIGITEKVPISRLRPMPSQLLEENPLAMKCKLFDCVPKQGTWCEDSINLMRSFLDMSHATISIMKILPDCWEVDLSATQNDCFDSEFHSLRDCMIFLEYANFVNKPSKKLNKYHDMNFVTPILPNIGDNFRCVISYVHSASKFFIQKLFHDTKYLVQMMNKMETIYDKENSKTLIYNPIIGMPCVAKYSEDNKWYRAKVIDLPGNKSVTVFYVDFGNEETIPWDCIRKIHPEFIKLAPQALHCSLAKTLPMEDYKWGSKAKRYLIENSNEKFWVKILAKEDAILKVALYYNDEQKTSINIQLMKQDCSFMENHSLFVESDDYHDISSESNMQSNLFSSASNEFYTNFNETGVFINKKYKKNFQKHKKPVIIERVYDNLEKISSDKSDKAFRTEVKILSVTSPSDIYVCAVGLIFKLKELEKSLQEYYQYSEVDREIKWNVDDKCVAFSIVYNKWCRSTITKILENDMFQVFFKDLGVSESIPFDNIRKLNDKYSDYPAGAIKCHLYGISPPENEWPGMTCEFLKNELERNQNIFMTGMGDLNKGSLPVRLWYKQLVFGGALEPTYEEWVTINDLIVKQGLAIPEKYKLMMDFEKYAKHSEKVEEKIDEIVMEITDKSEHVENLNAYSNNLKSSSISVATILPSEQHKLTTSNIRHAWRNDVLPTSDVFVGVPTYVDYECVIYLHDSEKDAPQLSLIKDVLSHYYSNVSPPGNEHQYWEVNQVCAVQYYIDKKWYRGQVIKKINDKSYEILFVDYGNVEVCSLNQMGKEIAFLDIPVLARKCVLHGILPITDHGKWRNSDIDYIYSITVDKKSQIIMIEKSEDVNKPSSISLILNTQISLVDHLVSRKMAKLIVPEEKEEDDKNMSCDINESDENHLEDDKIMMVPPSGSKNWTSRYLKLVIPEELSILKINVTKVSLEGFNARILDHSGLPENIRSIIRNHEDVMNKIQEMAPDQADLQNYVEGEPCICLHVEDNKWYRAEITDAAAEDDRVSINYVDRGDGEVVEKSRIRSSLESWIEIPVLNFHFKLRNVRKANIADATKYLTSLRECLSACESWARITSRDSTCLEVEVTSETNSGLVYQEMLDSGLMEVINAT